MEHPSTGLSPPSFLLSSSKCLCWIAEELPPAHQQGGCSIIAEKNYPRGFAPLAFHRPLPSRSMHACSPLSPALSIKVNGRDHANACPISLRRTRHGFIAKTRSQLRKRFGRLPPQLPEEEIARMIREFSQYEDRDQFLPRCCSIDSAESRTIYSPVCPPGGVAFYRMPHIYSSSVYYNSDLHC